MKRLLVTGGTGFLGTQIVNYYKNKADFEVFSASKSEGVDLTNYEQINQYIIENQPDTVIHCAAHVGGIQYDELYPIEVLEDNTLISMNIVKAVAENNVKTLIDVMPNCTYPAKYDIYEEHNWWEGELHDSVLVYGMPRKMLYVSCFAYLKKYDFKVVHTILPNLYGQGDHFDPVKSHALGALISKIVNANKNNESTVEIWGTGKPIREWLYVDDAVNAIEQTRISIDKISNNDIINIGTGKGISVIELALKIKYIVGWEGEFVFNTEKPDGALEKRLSGQKMQKILNWKPNTSFDEGLSYTIKNYLESNQ